MAKWIVLALIALSALPDAFTDAPRKCSQGCKNAPSHDFKFNIQPGHTYVYNFEATTETSVPGAAAISEDEKAGGDKKPGGERLHITGQAELSAGPACDHTMRLLHVQVTGADGKNHQDFDSCEKHPVGFSYNNGLLGDEICVEAEDNPSNLNVKRAILSLIQVSKVQTSGSATVHETDVFGTCPTDFTYHEEGGVLKVTKRRNLNRCAHREGLRNTFLSSSYDGPSDFQSSPLLQSSLQVEQTLKDHVLISAVGQEDYLFRPFSNGAAGARTTVTTKLTLVQHQPGPAPAVTDGHASSVIFDTHNWNLGGANPDEQATTALVSTQLKNAEKAAAGGVSMESAGLFRKLVKTMRYASSECLLEVYGQAKAGTGFSNKKSAKALFIDALLQTGTGQSIEAAVQLINSKDISPSVTKLYFLGLSFVRHATRGSLKAVATLLESPSIPPEALLGAGALVGRYCSEHQCDDSIPEFKVLVGKLAHKLGKGCKPVSRVHENEMVGALKGLLNARKLTNEAAEAILKCAVSDDVPTRVRVAALDAFRGDACHPKLKKIAMDVMKNREVDSELRIKAYLALAECPCDKVANAVKELMDTEPVNQVGSFISSHLLSLRTSSNPDRANAKHHLAGIRPKKRYPQDLRKFSRAFEMSYSLDGLNLGSSAEGNVIFSQKSFVPRSAMLNLTTDLFGHSFNLMELGVRAENVDHVLESILGPRGYFKKHSSNEVLTEGQETFNSFLQKVKERVRKTRGGKVGKRGKRGVTRDMVEALGKKVGHSVDHDDHSLDLDFNMKLFGSEVSWLNYHGNLKELNPDFMVDKFFDSLDEGFNKAKDFKLDFSPNVAFIDTELIYPTGAGFELRLSAAAYSSVELKVESQVDLPAMFKDPGNAKFHVKLVPSASVEVNGGMVVNAFKSVMAGLEVVGTMHSSTGLDIDAHLLENGNGIDVKLGLPRPKQEFFNVQTQVVSKRREKGSVPVVAPVKFDRNRKEYHGCFDQIAPATGLVICGDVQFPWDGFSSAVLPKTNRALFPLDGSFKASFHAEKDDPTLTHYHFRALYSNPSPHKKAFEMTFDTPNTKVDRTLQVLFEGECEHNKVARVSVKTPWKKFAVEGALINNDNEQSLTGKLMNDGDEYQAKLGLVVKSASGNKKVYTPTVELVFPEKKGKVPGKGPKGKKGGAKGLAVEGTITIESDDNTHKRIYTFDGVNFVTPKGKFGLQGEIARDDKTSLSSDMKFKYDDLKQYLGLKGKWHSNVLSEDTDDVSISTEAEFTASQFPDFGFLVKWDLERKPDHMENTFDLVHGPDLKSDVAHLHISNIVLYKYESDDVFEVSTKNSLSYPLLGVEGRLEGAVSRTNIQYGMAFKYDKHMLRSELDLKFGKTYQEGYDFSWEVEAFGSGFELDSKREVTSPKTSRAEVCLELKPGGRKYEIGSDLIHSYVGTKEFEFGANTVIKIPGHENYRIDGGVAVNPATFKSHLEMHVGQVCHLDVNAHGELASDGQCKSAEWKAMIKNYLDGSGHYTSMGNKGDKGDFVVNLFKAKRKLKGEYSLAHPGDGTCKTTVDLLWDADKDPSKKLHFESIAILPQGDILIDSKNVLVFEDKTTRLDFKVTKDGPLTAGGMTFAADVHLYTGRHISYNGHHKIHLRPSSTGDSEAEYSNAFCDKLPSGEQSCFTSKGGVNHLNIEVGTYDFHNEITYVQYDGKDLKFTLNGKSVPKGEKRELNGKGFFGGSLVGAKDLTVEWGGEVAKGAYTYHANGKIGDESLGFKGSLDTTLDGGKTSVGEVHLEGQTHISGLKTFAVGQKAKITTESPQIFDFSSTTDFKWDNDQTLTLGAKVNRHGRKGSASASVCLPGQTEDHAVSVEWNHDPGTPRVEGSVAVMWPQGKQVKLELQATTPKDSLVLHLVAYTPIEGLEKTELLINHRNIKAEHAMETDVTLLSSPDHKTSVHSRLEYAHLRRTLDITITCHHGSTYKAYVRLERKGDNLYESELKLDWGGEGKQLATESSIRFDGIDDFALHAFLDSSALKVNKWSIDIATKQGGGAKGGVKGGGKKIVFTGKKAEEVVFQGTMSFSRKQDGDTVTYEGTGNVKIGGETKNANFKLSTTYSAPEGGEIGLESTLNIGVSSSKGDKHTLVGETKLSARELRFFNSYCKGGDKCSHIEVYSKVNFQDLEHDMDHDFALILDLKELTNWMPISIKGSTHRTGDFNLDHKMEAQVDKGKFKYSYHMYLKEHEAGASLTLPNRTMAVVGTLHGEGKGKKDGGLGGFNADVTLWFDKEHQPNLKTSVSMLVDATESEHTFTLMFEGKLTHPSLEKPLSIRGQTLVGDEDMWMDTKVEFDVFNTVDEMIVMCTKLHHEPVSGGGHNVTALMDLKSKGQNIDLEWVTHASYSGRSFGVGTFATYLNSKNERRDVGVLLRGSPENVYLLVKAPTCELVRVDTKFEFSQAKQAITQEFCLFGQHTHIDNIEFKGLNSFKYHSFEKESPDDQFQTYGTLVWGKAMELHVDRLKGGQKEVLAYLSVALDNEHFLDAKHSWEQDKIKAYLSDVKNDFTHLVEEARKMSEEMVAEAKTDMVALIEQIDKSTSKLDFFSAVFNREIRELIQELVYDPVIGPVVKRVTDAFDTLIVVVAYSVGDLMEKLNVLRQKVVALYEKMMPMVNESVSKIMIVVVHEFERFSHYAVEAFEIFLNFMQQFSGEFKVVGKVIVQFLQDVVRTIAKLIDEVKHRYIELSEVAAEHFKAMPAFEYAKEMYEEFLRELPQQMHFMISEMLDTLKDSSPTQELSDFFAALKVYLIKKVEKVECDDEAEIENLYTLFVKGVSSVVELIHSQGQDYQLDTFFKTPMKFQFWPLGSVSQPLTFSYGDIARLPFFFAARFSPFFLKLEDFPRPADLLQEYWPSLPRGVIPPQNAYGILVGGEHFFTFDNRHYSLSGCACNYVLAQDFEDGNFSVIAHLEDGKLKSLTLMDTKETIVLNTDGSVQLNGAPSELPVRHGTISAWTEFDSVSIKTDYGARVTCDLRFRELCVVTVNGYYFGKTKGLLGTVNNEPYDDFVMPNGKIAPSVDKLANVWQVDPACSPVDAQSHDHEHVSQCSEMFAGYSSMRTCFPIVNPAGFREACDANVAMGGGDPCEVAAAYVIACRQEGIVVSVPNKCGQCTVGGSTLDLGYTVSLKAPQGKADVVLVVEQLPDNQAVFKDFVVPLVAALTNDLKAYKINDVKFVLVGFGGHGQKWPSIYTVNGHIGFDGKGDNVKFDVAKAEENKLLEDAPDVVKEYVRRLERMRKLVNVELGMVNYGEAFQIVRDYPFRPGAARTIVAVLQSRCLYSPLPFSSQSMRLFFQKRHYDLAGVSFHVVTPLEFSAPSKDKKQMKQVVGADKNSVFTLADAKKKYLEGDSQLRKEIKHEKDLCVDFAYGTNGAAFSSRNFVEVPKPAFKKQFIQVVSQRVAQSLAPEFTEDCICKLYHGLLPVTQCRITSRKERENLKAATKTVKG